MDIIEIMPTERVVRYLSSRLRGCARKPGVLKGPHHADEVASAARGSSGGRSGRASRSLARLRPSHWHSQSARAHVHATPPLERAHVGTRASFGTRAAQLGTHRLRQPSPQVHHGLHACDDAGDGRQDDPEVDDRRFKQVLSATTCSSRVKRHANVVDRGVAVGSTSRWRASRAAGGR